MDNQFPNLTINQLGTNSEFYNSVFKRIENTTRAVFYMLSFKSNKELQHPVLQSVSDKTLQLHEASLRTLTAYSANDASVKDTQQLLVSLDSTLRLASASQLVPDAVVNVLHEEIDGLQRYLANNVLNQSTAFALGNSTGTSQAVTSNRLHSNSNNTIAQAHNAGGRPNRSTDSSTSATPTRRPRRSAVPAGDISSDAYLVHSQLTDRAERIKTVLEAKPNATVKDVSQIITDVSEKTIQRELNSLIEKGQVVRKGERRWSTYSVVSK
jgi:hypothetical protein